MNRILTGLLAALLLLIPCMNVSFAADRDTIISEGGNITASEDNDELTPGQRSLVSRWAQEVYGTSDPKAWAAIACFNNKFNGTNIEDVNWISAGQEYFLPSKELFEDVLSQLNSDCSNFDTVMDTPGPDGKTPRDRMTIQKNNAAQAGDDDDDDDSAPTTNGNGSGEGVDVSNGFLDQPVQQEVKRPDNTVKEGDVDLKKELDENLSDTRRTNNIPGMGEITSVADENFSWSDFFSKLGEAFSWW